MLVAENPITFTYTPTAYEAKHSTFNMILENAQYQALQTYGGDVLVQVAYKVDGKGFGKMIRKVKSITITGYPAKYVDYRVPDENDRENMELIYKKSATKIIISKKN